MEAKMNGEDFLKKSWKIKGYFGKKHTKHCLWKSEEKCGVKMFHLA